MSMEEKFLRLPAHKQQEFLDSLDVETLEMIARGEWFWVARPEQIPAEGDWSIHLYLAGRGAGKTRSASEWLVGRSIDFPVDASGFPTERLVMAYNLSDTRITCIEGASGILRVMQRLGFKEHEGRLAAPRDGRQLYRYVKSPKPHITFWETGTKIHFTGADPDAARGFNLADAWCDEIVKWADPRAVWREGIRPALRADIPGDKPRALVTTTPKPIVLLQEWVKNREELKVQIARGSTFDNASNLSPDFLAEVKQLYEGTTLGRQELYGELLDSLDGTLFSFEAIDSNRVDIGPTRVAHRCVAVDPGLTGDDEADEMGVIVASRDHNDHVYIVADRSVRSAGREAALYAWRIFDEYGADTLVYESNLGKAWMHQVLTDAFSELQRAGVFPTEVIEPPLVPVFSSQGKKLRAEPVAMRYSQGRVHHIGRFEKLESQMLSFDPLNTKASPDRLDALVHACRHLMEGEKKRSFVLSPTKHRIPSLDIGVPNPSLLGLPGNMRAL